MLQIGQTTQYHVVRFHSDVTIILWKDLHNAYRADLFFLISYDLAPQLRTILLANNTNKSLREVICNLFLPDLEKGLSPSHSVMLQNHSVTVLTINIWWINEGNNQWFRKFPYQANPNRRNLQVLDFDSNKYKEVNCVAADTTQSIPQMSYLSASFEFYNFRR